MLLQMLNKINTATGLKPIPFGTTSTDGNYIVYNYYHTSDTGAVSQGRLELRLITHSVSDAEALRKKVVSALVTIGDTTEIDGINKVELNGGGQLKDFETNTIHTILYFDVIIRSEK